MTNHPYIKNVSFTPEAFKAGDKVEMIFNTVVIHGTIGHIATDRVIDGRIAVRWLDAVPGHPITWPDVGNLRKV